MHDNYLVCICCIAMSLLLPLLSVNRSGLIVLFIFLIVLFTSPVSFWSPQVHDVKFLAQTPEDKDAWIKAFTEGIDRAKNKIFDEVII